MSTQAGHDRAGDDGEARSTLITLRLTAEEGRRLTLAAAADRRTRAEYARIAVVDCVDAALEAGND